jgi:homotetrameric cytidine deaminase
MMKNLTDIFSQPYAPYSRQSEGALVRSSEGQYFPGIRIENISYPLSVTAAQNALFCCLSEGNTPTTLWVSHEDDPLLSFWEREFELTIKPLDPESPPDFQCAPVALDEKRSPNQILPDLLTNARVPYSNFPVSALIETEAGYFSGANIECSAWNMGLCAERIAIFKALTYRANHLKALHIHTADGEFSSPCGACRQVIMEHMPNKKVHLHHADYSTSTHFSNDLMPFSFQASSLSNSQ